VLVSTHYMDEAERCHKLAYIAWGELLAQGTLAEVVQSVGLTTFAIHGEALMDIEERLHGRPGVEQTVVFGNTLHVSGADGAALRNTLDGVARERRLRIEPVDTSLEDAFIALMKRAKEQDAPTRRAA